MKEKVLELLQEALPQIDFLSSDALVDDGILVLHGKGRGARYRKA